MSLFHPINLFVTCFLVGKVPFAPGTFGTIFSFVIAWLLFLMPGYLGFNPNFLLVIFPIITVACYFLGVKFSQIYEERVGKHDPKEVVIDEFVGMFTSICAFGVFYMFALQIAPEVFSKLIQFTEYYMVTLFVFFRIFDITKPSIIGYADKNYTGGKSIMLDDVYAGIFSGVASFAIFIICYFFGIFEYLL